MGAGRGSLAGVVALAIAVAGTAPAQAGSPDASFTRYARTLDQVRACVLDSGYGHLSGDHRRKCRRYRKLYVVYTTQGESAYYQLHCLTRRCPRSPAGTPSGRAPIPRGSKVYRP